MHSQRLTELAEVIADGSSPDWDAADLGASDEERPLIRHLRAASGIAQARALAYLSSLSARELTPGPPLEPGASWGSLRVLEQVGRGHFGHVYRAWDSTLDRQVALKILHQRAGPGDTEDGHVIEEGRLMARVRHPNVVTIFGAQRIDGRTGLWMEFIQGTTLEAELRARGPLAPEEVARIGRELCGALGAVHAAGLVHRDVKAQNVLREPNGRTVLGDFGTGRELVEDDVEAPELAGTPAYAAPEVFRGETATPQSDLYSLGVLLFHLATGSYPVRGASIREIRDAHTAGRRATLRSERPDLPARLAATIDRALESDPARRFENATAMERSIVPLRTHYWRLAAAALLITTVGLLVALVRELRFPPAGRNPGITVEHLDPTFQQQVFFRGPAIGNHIPCTQKASDVAICDLRDRSVRVLKAEVVKPGRSGEYAPAQAAILSPDGAQLAYTWITRQAGKETSAIHVIDVDGGNDRELFVSAGTAAVKRWIHDGRALSVDERRGDVRRDILVPTRGGPATEVWPLTPEDWLSDLSPDGRLLAISRFVAPRDRDLVVVDTQTRRERWRLTHPADDVLPVWTPDGDALVFVSDRFGSESVLLIEGARSNQPGKPMLLREMGRHRIHSPPIFAPDGSLFMRVRTAPKTAYLASISAEPPLAGSPTPLEPRAVDDSLGADWSPDGKRMAYLRGRTGTPTTFFVVVRHADGRLEREFPIEGVIPEFVGQVRWSPSGGKLAVTYHGGPDPLNKTSQPFQVLDVIDVASGKRRRVAQATIVNNPRWDRTERALFFVHVDREARQPGAIRRLDLQTGAIDDVFRPPDRGVMGPFDRTSDGQLLVRVNVPNIPACVFRVVKDGAVHRDFQFEETNCPAAGWIGDGPKILVGTTRTGQDGRLWIVDTETDERTLLTVETELISQLSISKDGRQLLFTGGNPRPEMWMLRGLPGPR